jgi:hypothetical protein
VVLAAVLALIVVALIAVAFAYGRRQRRILKERREEAEKRE